jgi:hypothetical protein
MIEHMNAVYFSRKGGGMGGYLGEESEGGG